MEGGRGERRGWEGDGERALRSGFNGRPSEELVIKVWGARNEDESMGREDCGRTLVVGR